MRGRTGVAHGGVAVLAKASCTKMKEISFPNPEEFEVLPVCISVANVEKKLYIIAVYLPPGYTVARGRECLQHINDLVLHIKNISTETHICVMGDFNQWNIAEALDDYPDLLEVVTPPTRNGRRIDRVFLNWPVIKADCLPPLETEEIDGVKTKSDHMVQFVRSDMDKFTPSVWRKITFRPFNIKSGQNFIADMAQETWEGVLRKEGSNSKANEFQRIIDKLMDKHFPIKSVRHKESDLPWFNATARKKCKRKKAVFRDEGKSERWMALRDDLDEYLAARQEKYLEKQRTNLIGGSAYREFYKNIKSFGTAERPKSFDVRNLRPGVPDEGVANEVAEYFNRISSEFEPLKPWEIPRTYEREIFNITEEMVATRLRTMKKPKSRVEGDIFPQLVGDCANYLSIPLANIFQTIMKTYVWPIDWKREYVTVIPKKSMPNDISELRNISCTKLFSKTFETFVLQYAKEEIEIKKNQYGGEKGCSTSHMLIDIWQEICDNAEDYRSATVLTAIDYSKAFNRVSFQHCLKAFAAKGASSNTIRLLATFLTNRQMAVRVGESWSKFLPVNGGCPQGSILGVFIFNTTTDDLEDPFLREEDRRLPDLPSALHDLPARPREQERQELDESVQITGEPRFSTPESIQRDQPPDISDLSPIGSNLYRHSDMVVQIEAINAPLPEPPAFEPRGPEIAVGTQVLVEKKVGVAKYIDDNIIVEKVNFGNVAATEDGDEPTKTREATGSKNAFACITSRAADKGMLVNDSKTNMLCVSDSLSYVPHTFFRTPSNELVKSSPEMKVLGYNFSNRPTPALHIQRTITKLKRNYWTLRHLRNIGFNNEELVEVYKSSIRPAAEYCSVVFHSMMTDEQDEALENAQVGALRAIYGYGESGRKMRSRGSIPTLRSRRVDQCDKFARKCAESPRFSHWFPLRERRRNTRNNELYVEEYARCDRLRNSPLFYMRRRLNGKEGKTYGQRYRIYRET